MGFGSGGGFWVGVLGCAGWEGVGEFAGDVEGPVEFGGGDAVVEMFFVGGECRGRWGALRALGDGFEIYEGGFDVLGRVLGNA